MWNTEVMNSSKDETWITPDDFFKMLDDEFHFTLDAASSDENAKCIKHYTEHDDGLAQDWSGEIVFVNPPYCRKTGTWVRKCMNEGHKPGTTVVALLPCRPDTSWFHEFILGKAQIRFVRGRLKFGGKDRAPFPSMVCVWGLDLQKQYRTVSCDWR